MDSKENLNAMKHLFKDMGVKVTSKVVHEHTMLYTAVNPTNYQVQMLSGIIRAGVVILNQYFKHDGQSKEATWTYAYKNKKLIGAEIKIVSKTTKG